MHLKRTHAGGIESSIQQESFTLCKISIKHSQNDQSPGSFLAFRETTLDGAKRIADEAVKQSGHVCNGACKDWESV
jgi:hypothetical protein